MDLEKLIIPSKAITMEYPGYEGFEVELSYISKGEVAKLRKKATKGKASRRGQVSTDVDPEVFEKVYIAAIVTGWEGFKYEYLEEMIPVDLSDAEGDELEYSPANAVMLMKNIPDFDAWVSEILDDISNFTSGK